MCQVTLVKYQNASMKRLMAGRQILIDGLEQICMFFSVFLISDQGVIRRRGEILAKE